METGPQVRFTRQGENRSFTYTGTASGTPGSYSFGGKLRDTDKIDYDVRGVSSVTVQRASNPGPPAVPTNNSPTFPADRATRSVPENTGAGMDIGARVRGADRDGDTLTGDDAGSFAIGRFTGQMMTRAPLDCERPAGAGMDKGPPIRPAPPTPSG